MLASIALSLMASFKLKSVVAAIEADSIPLTWQELYGQLPKPDTHPQAQSNLFAALDALAELPELSREAMQRLPVEGVAELPDPSTNLPPPMVSSLELRLDDVKTVLADLRDALADDPVWLVLRSYKSGSPYNGRYSAIRRTARLLCMSAVLHSARHETEAAVDAVIAGMKASQVLGTGGMVVDELVRLACEGLAIRSLEHLLAKTDPSSDDLLVIDTLLSDLDGERSVVAGEMIHMRQMYGLPRTEIISCTRAMLAWRDTTPWYCLPLYLPRGTGWVRMNEAYHLGLLHTIGRIWALPWNEFNRQYDEALRRVPRLFYISRIYCGAYSSIKNRELRANGARDCGRIAIAIERYSRQNGRLPETLSGLVPDYLNAIPTNPFDGSPITYEADEHVGVLSFPYPEDKGEFRFQVFAFHNIQTTENEWDATELVVEYLRDQLDPAVQDLGIRPNALIGIMVPEDPALNGTYPVNGKGLIQFGYVGAIPLNGQGESSAANVLTRVLKAEGFEDPKVQVRILRTSTDRMPTKSGLVLPAFPTKAAGQKIGESVWHIYLSS